MNSCLENMHVRDCSTDFQQWLWWAHREWLLARWVCEKSIPTNDRCDMADWFIQYVYDDIPDAVSIYYKLLGKHSSCPKNALSDFSIFSSMSVYIEKDDFASESHIISLEELHDWIHDLHFTYYNEKVVGWNTMNELRPSAYWAGERTSKGIRFSILKRDNYRCRLCGFSAQDGVKLQVDHIRPKAKGGSSFVWNLWTLCEPCNNGKRARLLYGETPRVPRGKPRKVRA